jgi:hypothetical protein
MTRKIFIVLVPFGGDEDAVLEKAREALPASDIFVIDSDKFAVVSDGTSRDIAEKLGIRGEPVVSSGVVFPVSSYSGRADPALWEWLDSKLS